MSLNGCECQVTFTIPSISGPTVSANANPNSVCLGGTIALTATVTGGTGTMTYSWTNPTGGGLSATNIQNPTATPTTGGNKTYAITMTDGSGCTATSSVTVTVDDPSVALNDITSNPTSPVCEGTNVELSVTPSANEGTVTYAWVGPNGFTSTDQRPELSNITAAQAGIYTVTATATKGSCTATASNTMALAVNNPAVVLNDITFNPTSPVCEGSEITMSVSWNSHNGDVSYIWEGPGFSSPVAGQSQTLNSVTTAEAGTYTVTATATVGSCTATDTKEAVLTVNPAPSLSVDVPTQTITYGQPMATVTLTATNATSIAPIGALPSWMTYDATNHTLTGTPTAAGSYTVTMRAAGAEGCSNDDVTVTVIVDKATATVTADDKSKVYGDAEPMLTATVTGLQNGDAASVISYTLSRDEGEDVGTYTITPAGDAVQGNYNVVYTTGTLTITKATVTVTADNKTKVYDHSDPVLTATLSGLKHNDPSSVISYTLSRVPGEDVGTYTITPAGNAVQGNYDVTYVTGTLTITQLDVTVNITGNTSMQAHTGSTLSVSGFTAVSDNSLYDVAAVNCTTATASGVEVGTYPMGLVPAAFTNSDDNFNVTFNIVSDGWLQIVPAGTVIVTIEGHNSVLDYDANEHSVSGYDVDIWVPEGSPAYTTADFTFSGNATATRTVVGTTNMGLAASQFTNTNPDFQNVMFNVTDGYLTINKANVEVIVTGHTAIKEYDNIARTVSGYEKYATSPLYDITNVGFTGDATATRTVVGITNMGLAANQFTNSDNNFNVTFNVNDGWLEIVAAGTVIVNIIGNNDAYTYNGTEQSVTGYTVGNIEGHHTETHQAYSEYYPQTAINFIGTTADQTAARTDVGTTFMNLTEDMFENTDPHFIVRFHVTNGYVKVNPAPVTVTIEGANHSDVFDGAAHTVTGYNVTSVKINDVETTIYTSSHFTFSGVASASRTAVGTTNMNLASNQFTNTNSNFGPVTFVVTDGYQTITPATMAITITGTTYETTYDAQAHTVSGYTATSTSSLFNPAKVVRTGGTPSITETNAGTYNMNLESSQFSYDDANFENVTFSVTDGWLKINQANLTVTITGHNDTKAYNGSEQSVTGYDISIPSGAALTSDEISGPAQSAAIAKGTNVKTDNDGKYMMGLTASDFSTTNTNYNVSFSVTDGWLKITPIDVTVTIEGAHSSTDYDGNEHSVNGYTATANNTLYDITNDFTQPAQDATVATAARTDVGTTMMALSAADFANTNTNFSNVTFNVTPGYQTIEPADVTVCHGTLVTAVEFGYAVGMSYDWVATGDAIGMSVTSGTGNIPAFTAANTGTSALTATITVTPKFTRGGVDYPCEPFSYTITANALPGVSITAVPELCPNIGTYPLEGTVSQATTGDYTYTWSGDLTVSPATTTQSGTTHQPTATIPSSNCNTTYNVTLEVADGHGCTQSASVVVTVRDNEAPALSGTWPANITGQNNPFANADFSGLLSDDAAAALYSDNCGGTVTASHTDANTLTDDCYWKITRTYTITDACGNTVTPDPTMSVSGFDKNVLPQAETGVSVTGQTGSAAEGLSFVNEQGGKGSLPRITPTGALIQTTLPTVNTSAISAMTATTAISGGEIVSDGGAGLTARGVCWSTQPNPTLTDNSGFTVNGYCTGTFSSELTGLTSGTTYYVRAYATNGMGTSYGEVISFMIE